MLHFLRPEKEGVFKWHTRTKKTRERLTDREPVCPLDCGHSAIGGGGGGGSYVDCEMYAYWVEAGIEVERRIGGKEGEPLPPLQLNKEVEGAVVVRVGYNSGPSNPQIDLYRI